MAFPQLRRIVLSVTTILMATGCLMSDAIAQSLLSPEVHSDGRVTLRLRAAKAAEVEVSLAGKKLPMTKNDKGVWEGTSEPLAPQIYDYTFKVERPDNYFQRNNDLYEKDITKDLLPYLEERFHVRTDAAGRSIVGLSMGGGHALDTGLRNIDKFSSIGAFSAATPELETPALLQQYPSLSGTDPVANTLRHLWIPIGDKDFLLERNDKFVEQLRTAGVKSDYVKTEGGHEWKLWRDYLPQFLEKVVAK